MRGRAAGVRQRLLLRADVPRREEQDAPPPRRVLDGRARGRVHGPRRRHGSGRGLPRRSSWSACSRTRREELKVLERDIAKLERVQKPFPRITYDEAIELLQKNGHAESQVGRRLRRRRGDGRSREQFDRPVIVHRYPTASKAFYFKRDPSDPTLALDMDVLAPEGYGEIIGGGQREDDLAKLEAASTSTSCRARPSSGTSTCAATAPSRTRASGSASSAPCLDLRAAPRSGDDSFSALDGKDRTVIKSRDEIPYLLIRSPPRIRLRRQNQQQRISRYGDEYVARDGACARDRVQRSSERRLHVTDGAPGDGHDPSWRHSPLCRHRVAHRGEGERRARRLQHGVFGYRGGQRRSPDFGPIASRIARCAIRRPAAARPSRATPPRSW